MAKHTPGPWKIFEGWGADRNRPVIVDSIPDVDGKFVGNCICYAASTNPDIEANAKMIAAAPEMFEAIESMLVFLACSPSPETNELWQKISRAYDKAKSDE